MPFDFANQRLLITGATGSLGTWLLAALAERGVYPIVQVRERSKRSFVDRLGLEARCIDLTSRTGQDSLVQGVDAVIHCAAWVNFRQDSLDRFMEINTRAAVRLYKACRAAGVKRFVQVSSVVSVGGAPRNGCNETWEDGVNEESPFNVGDLHIPYIVSKRAAEIELAALSDEGGPELVIVNLPKLVSPSQGGNDQAKISKLFRKPFLPRLENRFNLGDIRDAAAGTLAALEKGRNGERYLLGGENTSISEMVAMLSKRLGKPPRLVGLPLPLIRFSSRFALLLQRIQRKKKRSFYPDLVGMLDYDWTCSSQKAVQELGYAWRPLEQTLGDLLDGRFKEPV